LSSPLPLSCRSCDDAPLVLLWSVSCRSPLLLICSSLLAFALSSAFVLQVWRICTMWGSCTEISRASTY
jgi:hypothetical protein